eukprot:652567-Rhodomonas_salina.2
MQDQLSPYALPMRSPLPFLPRCPVLTRIAWDATRLQHGVTQPPFPKCRDFNFCSLLAWTSSLLHQLPAPACYMFRSARYPPVLDVGLAAMSRRAAEPVGARVGTATMALAGF